MSPQVCKKPDFGITAKRAVSIMERLIFEKGKPEAISVDNGPAFMASAMQEWWHNKFVFPVFSKRFNV